MLSDTTEAYDRGKKFEHYRRIPSLREYVLVAQDRCHIEVYSRSDAGFWMLSEVNDREGVLSLASLGCSLAVAEIYDRVELDQTE